MKQLIKTYTKIIRDQLIQPDPAQAKLVEALNRLVDEVSYYQTPFMRCKVILKRFLGLSVLAPKGFYIWGGVGRGKTYFLDLFFEHLPTKRKKRLHFHRFMKLVHSELKAFQGKKDPLKKVVTKWSKRCDILCLDELFIVDIADAMILSELLEQLFYHGITLVTTTNIPPDALYQNGLQRDKFLPAIELIKKFTTIFCLDSKKDYRLNVLEKAEIYHSPLDAQAEINLKNYFLALSPHAGIQNKIIVINDREVQTKNYADNIIWLDFSELCIAPRSSSDYIEFAKYFHTILISNLIQMTEENEDVARRFVNMVDEFYDRNVKMIVSSEVPIPMLYQGRLLSFEFERVISRLTEMQTIQYLSLPHLG